MGHGKGFFITPIELEAFESPRGQATGIVILTQGGCPLHEGLYIMLPSATAVIGLPSSSCIFGMARKLTRNKIDNGPLSWRTTRNFATYWIVYGEAAIRPQGIGRVSIGNTRPPSNPVDGKVQSYILRKALNPRTAALTFTRGTRHRPFAPP